MAPCKNQKLVSSLCQQEHDIEMEILLTVKSHCHVLRERDKQETEIATQPENCITDIGEHHKLSNEFIKTVSSNLACFFHHLEREMIIHNCNCCTR
jgi:hypothetical protein